MMLFLMAASAAGMTPVTPKGDPATWVGGEDLASFKVGGTTEFDLMIDPAGRPVKCVIAVSSGTAALDMQVCRALMTRAQFKPATDRYGAALPSMWSDRVKWRPKQSGPNNYFATPSEVMAEFPSGFKKTSKPLKVQLVELVAADASTEECAVLKKSKETLLNNVACASAAKSASTRVILNGSGNPVRGIRTTMVIFSK